MRDVGAWIASIAALMLGTAMTLPLRAQQAGPVKVQAERTSAGYRLLRSGQPYFIKGAGGDRNLEQLRATGGNSIRTWGSDNVGPLLDRAQKLGLTVTVGIWLGQERQGFRYDDPKQVAEQYERARQAILQYRDHPALLMWGLGNEMEGDRGDNPAIWNAIEAIAKMAKQTDPNHPTMTVIAEIGGEKIPNLHRLCPDIDVVGINSYGGAPSVAERYRKLGGTKPYVLTEFGPTGSWEVAKTSWGAPIEPTSTEKAAHYRRSYEAAVRNQPLALGAYAFLWGHKQETTATWFGMLLPGGDKTPAVDVMQELWTGKPPANRCPAIAALKLEGKNEVDPGSTLQAALTASDPDSDPVQVEWVVQPEAARYGAGGDDEARLPSLPGTVVQSAANHAEVRAPKAPGGYRLFAFVRDGKGGAAVGNLPFYVKRGDEPGPAPAAKLPLVVYDEADRPDPPYASSGWMGSTKAVRLDEAWKGRPHAGKTCLRCEYNAGGDWGGVAWQNPPGDWGDRPGGWKLTGARRLVFWARGDRGGEVVSFKFGILGRDKHYFDTAQGELGDVKLTPEWKQYSIDLAGKDLSRVKTPFTWVVAAHGQPVLFYLDDIRFE